jgi:hypothetical protein
VLSCGPIRSAELRYRMLIFNQLLSRPLVFDCFYNDILKIDASQDVTRRNGADEPHAAFHNSPVEFNAL